jgi:hypothetical protein
MSKRLLQILFLSFITASLYSCKSEPVETITYLTAPTGANGSESSLHKAQDGTIYLSWIETDKEKNSKLLFSTLGKNNIWSTPKPIASGNDWFVNWADFPNLTSFGENGLATHYLKKSGGSKSYNYDVKMIISNDKGNTWNNAFAPHTDNTQAEHGFVSKVEMTDDSFLSVWLDGRQSAYAEKDSTIVREMTLRSALISKEGELLEEYLLDSRVCDCCQTDVAMTSDGPIVIYRDRSQDEIRDIYYVRQVNNEWTEPKPIFNDNWNIAGCPVNGASISANKDATAIAWFTMANDTPKVKVVFSNNNGETFDTPIQIGDVDPLGRVDIELLEDNSALVSWMDVVNDNTVIQLQRVQQDGTISEIVTLTESSESRSSGFPRMVIKDNLAYLSWTHVGDDNLDIKTAIVNTSLLK